MFIRTNSLEIFHQFSATSNNDFLQNKILQKFCSAENFLAFSAVLVTPQWNFNILFSIFIHYFGYENTAIATFEIDFSPPVAFIALDAIWLRERR